MGWQVGGGALGLAWEHRWKAEKGFKKDSQTVTLTPCSWRKRGHSPGETSSKWKNDQGLTKGWAALMKVTPKPVASICLKTCSLPTSSHYIQFSSVQSLIVSDSLQPHEPQHSRPPCPSPTPGVHSDSRPSSQWCHPTISLSNAVSASTEMIMWLCSLLLLYTTWCSGVKLILHPCDKSHWS